MDDPQDQKKRYCMRITLTFYLRRGTVHVGSVAELFNCLAFNPNLSKSVYLNLNPDFYSSGLLAIFSVFLSVMLIVLKDQLQGDFLLTLKAPISQNDQTHSNNSLTVADGLFGCV